MNVGESRRRGSYSGSTIPVFINSPVFMRNWKYVGKTMNSPDYYIKCSYSDHHDCSSFKFQDKTHTCCEANCDSRLMIVCFKCKACILYNSSAWSKHQKTRKHKIAISNVTNTSLLPTRPPDPSKRKKPRTRTRTRHSNQFPRRNYNPQSIEDPQKRTQHTYGHIQRFKKQMEDDYGQNGDDFLQQCMQSKSFANSFPSVTGNYGQNSVLQRVGSNAIHLMNSSRHFKKPLTQAFSQGIPTPQFIRETNANISPQYVNKAKKYGQSKKHISNVKYKPNVTRRQLTVEEEEMLTKELIRTQSYTPSGSVNMNLYAKTSRKKLQQNMRGLAAKLVESGKLRKTRGTGRRFVERKLKENRIKKPLAGDDQFGCSKCKQLPLYRQELEFVKKRINTLRHRVATAKRGSRSRPSFVREEAVSALKEAVGRELFLKNEIDSCEEHQRLNEVQRKCYQDVLNDIVQNKDTETVRITSDYVKHYLIKDKGKFNAVNTLVIALYRVLG